MAFSSHLPIPVPASLILATTLAFATLVAGSTALVTLLGAVQAG